MRSSWPLRFDHFERPLDAVFEFGGGHAVEAGEEAQVLDDGEVVVEREFLRHVADVLAHGFGLAADVEARNLRAARGRA